MNLLSLLRQDKIELATLDILKTFLLVSLPSDINDNRRHIHIFKQGKRGGKSIAKIWIERNGEKDIEVVDSELKSSDEKEIIKYIDENWDFLNKRITTSFNGEKLRKHGKI